MRFLQSKGGRALLYILGFICFLGFIYAGIAAILKFYVFEDGDYEAENFFESEAFSYWVGSDASNLAYYMMGLKVVDSTDYDDTSVNIYELNDASEELYDYDLQTYLMDNSPIEEFKTSYSSEDILSQDTNRYTDMESLLYYYIAGGYPYNMYSITGISSDDTDDLDENADSEIESSTEAAIYDDSEESSEVDSDATLVTYEYDTDNNQKIYCTESEAYGYNYNMIINSFGAKSYIRLGIEDYLDIMCDICKIEYVSEGGQYNISDGLRTTYAKANSMSMIYAGVNIYIPGKFLYVPDAGFLYTASTNSQYYDVTFAEYVYIPVKYIYYSRPTERGDMNLIMAPHLNTLLDTYVAALGENFYYSLVTVNDYGSYIYNMNMSEYAISKDGTEIYETNTSDYANTYATLSESIISHSDAWAFFDGTKWKSYYRLNGDVHEADFVYPQLYTDYTDFTDSGYLILGYDIDSGNVSSDIVIQYMAFKYGRLLDRPLTDMVLIAVVLLTVVILLTIGTRCRLTRGDTVPIELYIAVLLGLLFLVLWGVKAFYYGFIGSVSVSKDALGSVIALGVLISLLLYHVGISTYLSIVRRLKTRRFWRMLLVPRLFRWIQRRVSSAAASASNKELLIMRVVGFVLINVISIMAGLFLARNSILLTLILAAAVSVFDFLHVLKLFGYYRDVDSLLEVSHSIEDGDLTAKTEPSKLSYNTRELGESLNSLGDGLKKAVDISTKDERMKAELITNVSHDIKTPLTSIINYVDLLKREEIDNPKAEEYIRILDEKSQRLKMLILDLIEVSKTSTGNIELECMRLNLKELLGQTLAEFDDKLAAAELTVVCKDPEDVTIYGDGRRVFRIIQNLLENVVKYAMHGTRVYITLEKEVTGELMSGDETDSSEDISVGEEGYGIIRISNISKEMLDITPEELTERFVRGDKSRNTEGSGLGLSIAKNLCTLQDGYLDIEIDGDMFKATMALPLYNSKIDI